MQPGDEKVEERMRRIAHKVLVLSGKGGVGKSTIAVNIAASLATAGRKVGLLDIDIHGPSIPNLLGLCGLPIGGTKESIHPFSVGENLRVMSIGFLLRSDRDAVIWRGPMKYNVIKQFLSDVDWGELDYLIVDSPPGTGDEPLSIAQLIRSVDGALVVTTPQDIALIDVRKCIDFCNKLSIPIIGVVENMSGFICPKCGEQTDIFKSGGGELMAREMNVPFLGRVPVDPGIVSASDGGRPYVTSFPHTETGEIFASIAAPIFGLDGAGAGAAGGGWKTGPAGGRIRHARNEQAGESDRSVIPGPCNHEGEPAGGKRADKTAAAKIGENMRIAIPVVDGALSMHFGHSDEFALIDVESATKRVLKREDVKAPPHQPGLLPTWLAERGARIIIASGMGRKARTLFAEQGIRVIVGAPAETPERLVGDYLAGTLQVGENVCDH